MDNHSKIAILGFGTEGMAVLKYLKKHKYDNITVCDRDVDLKKKMPDGVSVRLGKDYLNGLSDFDVVFRSPGIKYLDPLIQSAKNRKEFSAGGGSQLKLGSPNGTDGLRVSITSSTAFFLDQAPCKVIGVTGTKGKGTTATLIYLMLKKAKKDVYLGGNIGDPAIEFLDKLKKTSFAVLELSSFQLQDLEKSPHFAVLLNTTVDHLDYHVDRDEYLQAKESLLAHQGKNSLAVFNKDYEYVKYYLPLVKGEKKFVSVKGEVKDGAFTRNGGIFYAKSGKEEKIADVKEIALIGSHNLENILPAVAVAKEIGVETKDIRDVIKTFKGLPHRLEFVREVNGVKYYDDSVSTIPEPSMAAVDSFDVPTVLIAGGASKGLSYDEWAVKILTKPSLTTVILIGQTADEMESCLRDAWKKLGDAIGSPTKIIRCKTLEEAVKRASKEASKGGVAVLSPAATSFDMFKNYKERGVKFVEAVGRLKG
ncbi:UDP-N-acetylmuramoyl-L-alanine--D-glutamate ligase [Candidatus Peregrinibacteria bacterium]|nr:UDP-N-acetylmuramoyl-L-alanine--D-glutamate ligase [Candidatus Peregrinibacteria bacterium]